MSDGFITSMSKVRALLELYPTTRDSDKLLWLAYLVNYHGLKTSIGDEAYMKFREILMNESTPTMESVTRARRKVQESDSALCGEKKSERLKQEKQMREILQ